jgi:2-oxoisovalerate dehydrogenase E2 component (dihydrolipoyl transacylase)
LRLVRGTGPAGRVLHEDLEAYLAQGQSNASAALAAAYAQRNDEEQIPVIGMRRKIAQRMQDATQRAAHFSYVEEIDVTAIEELRAHLNENTAPAGQADLAAVPGARHGRGPARLPADQRPLRRRSPGHHPPRRGARGRRHPRRHRPDGAGVRHAEARSLWDSAAEIARLATAARNGKASRDELSGSTITLTSLGALGGIVSTPVLNLPEVAIVGVNRIVERPMVIKGQIVIRKMMNLSSSFDHRVVDGMDAALFIQAVRGLLEQPATLFVE